MTKLAARIVPSVAIYLLGAAASAQVEQTGADTGIETVRFERVVERLNGFVEISWLPAPADTPPAYGLPRRPLRTASLFLRRNAELLGISARPSELPLLGREALAGGGWRLSFGQTHLGRAIQTALLEIDVVGRVVTRVEARFVPDKLALPDCASPADSFYVPIGRETRLAVIRSGDNAYGEEASLLDACGPELLDYWVAYDPALVSKPFDSLVRFYNGFMELDWRPLPDLTPHSGSRLRSPALTALEFLERHADVLELPEISDIVLLQQTESVPGTGLASFEQTHRGLRVDTSGIDVVVEDSIVTRVTARFAASVADLPLCELEGVPDAPETFYMPIGRRTNLTFILTLDVSNGEQSQFKDACTLALLDGYTVIQ